MNDEIARLRDAVVEAAKRAGGREAGGASKRALCEAVDALNAAEEAEKRSLRRAQDVVLPSAEADGMIPIGRATACILARDAEWLAAIRAIAASQGNVYSVLLEDIETLAASAKP